MCIINSFPTLLLLFGMGKIFERLNEIEGKNNKIETQTKVVTSLLNNVESKDDGKWKCSYCGRKNASYVGTCACGKKRDDN